MCGFGCCCCFDANVFHRLTNPCYYPCRCHRHECWLSGWLKCSDGCCPTPDCCPPDCCPRRVGCMTPCCPHPVSRFRLPKIVSSHNTCCASHCWAPSCLPCGIYSHPRCC